MATTYFVTSTFVGQAINTEAELRSSADTEQSKRIDTLKTAEADLRQNVIDINKDIENLSKTIDNTLGTGVLDTYIKFPETYIGTRNSDGSAYANTTPKNITEGINALSSIFEAHIATFSGESLGTVAELNSQMDGYIANYNAQTERLNAILALAPIEQINGTDETIDTFAEVVALINQIKNNSGTSSEFDLYQDTVEAQLLTKADKIQKIDTTTRYIDSTTQTSYKLYVSGGQLVLEDV